MMRTKGAIKAADRTLRRKGIEERGIPMRRFIIVAVGLIGGIIAGLFLSEAVGAVGFLLFDRAVGIRYLPVVLGIVGAVAVPFLDTRARRTSKEPPHDRNQRSKA